MNHISNQYGASIKRLFAKQNVNICIPIGEANCICDFQMKDLITYFKKRYIPKNIAIIVKSDLDINEISKFISNTQFFFFHKLKNDLIEKKTRVLPYIANSDGLENCLQNNELHFLSKHQRIVYSVEACIENRICLNIALELISQYLRNYFANKNTDCIVEYSVEIISTEVFLIQICIKFGVVNKEINIQDVIKAMSISKKTFINVKDSILFILIQDFEKEKSSNREFNANEYIENFLFNEPILDIKDEFIQLKKVLSKIRYTEVLKAFLQIKNDIILVE
jgi:hypothetical protein